LLKLKRREAAINNESDVKYNKRRRIAAIISASVLFVLFILVTVLLWGPLTGIFKEPEKFRSLIDSYGIWGVFAFIGMVILQIIFAIIPGEAMEFAAGFVFGTYKGLLLCLFGAVIGSALVFMLTRKYGVKLTEAIIGRDKLKSLRFLKENKNINAITFLLYFIPGTPKDMITYFIGLTSIKFKTFLLISTLGRIPSIITSTIAGNAFGTKKYLTAVIVYTITGVISVVGFFIYKKKNSRNC
jgi:uncharacterized membrane protein YdjX (TVP38/TMEM64 family)